MRDISTLVHLVNRKGDIIEAAINQGGLVFYPLYNHSSYLTKAVESGQVKWFPIAVEKREKEN